MLRDINETEEGMGGNVLSLCGPTPSGSSPACGGSNPDLRPSDLETVKAHHRRQRNTHRAEWLRNLRMVERRYHAEHRRGFTGNILRNVQTRTDAAEQARIITVFVGTHFSPKITGALPFAPVTA